ncbi:MAG: 6-phosphogluconolactonase [Oscillospiraceae bacterium]|nr:6-phosphogluconolactonase [Oscillospiraceae bacterium]
MKTVILEQADLIRSAADEICSMICEKPGAVFTMAAGRTMMPLWRELSGRVREGKLSFAEARFFQMAEFLSVPEEYTFRRQLEEGFVSKTDLRPEACFWLDETGPATCDDAIAAAGGLDFAVLGIGNNAHIGLNEPATQWDTRCRIQKLTEKTRRQYAWMFPEGSVPEKAVTMGIRTLTSARNILVLALGEEKAPATFSMLYARDDSVIPAAFLQLPRNVTVYTDPAAAKSL